MQINNELKYHYLYKITNILNGKFYIGIHSTNNLNDGYFGSGSYLNRSIKKWGKENFKKEILEFRETRNEISDLEKEIVTLEFIQNPLTYNIKLGGDDGKTIGTVAMKDLDGKYKRVAIGSPEYFQMEQVSKGKCTVFDIQEQKYVQIPSELYFQNKERYLTPTLNKVSVFDSFLQKKTLISCDEYLNNKERYKHSCKDTITVKDSNDNTFKVSINDPKYLNGELKPIWCGRKHKKEFFLKQKETLKKIKHQQGEKNSQWGTCWIMKDGISKKIKREELEIYLNDGWIKGRKMNKSLVNSEYQFLQKKKKEEKQQFLLDIKRKEKKQKKQDSLNNLLNSDYFSLTESQKQTYRKHKCWICGSMKGECKDPLVCKKHQLLKPLIKFGLDYSLIGTSKIIDEFYRIKTLIEEHYLKWNSNNEKLIEVFNYNSGSANFIKVLKSLSIKIK